MAPTVPPPLRLYGHRGAAAERPENTVPSFERALELGVDALEMDVHRTGDGHIVVSHDPSGHRMAGVPKRICECTLAEVQSWDVGRGFVDAKGERPFAGKGYSIPTLEEILERFQDTPLNVDIKQRDRLAVRPLTTLLRRLGAEQRVTVASFHDAIIRSVRDQGYRGPTVLARNEVVGLVALPQLARHWWPVRGAAVQVPERYGPVNFCASWFIDRCHALGLRIDFWTVNDPVRAERLLDLGADGLMTDDPAAVQPAVERWRTLHRR